MRQLRDTLLGQIRRQSDCYRRHIIPGLAGHGIGLRRWTELTPAQQEEARSYFEANLSPALTPLVIDPVHPFPFLSNLSTSLTFQLREPGRGGSMYARVKVPGGLTQWVPLAADVPPGQKLFVPLYDIIRGNLDKLYRGMTISAPTVVRLTRDAEVEIDDDPDTGLRELVQEAGSSPAIRAGGAPGVRARRRSGHPRDAAGALRTLPARPL
jgi:polyphosphate kinase